MNTINLNFPSPRSEPREVIEVGFVHEHVKVLVILISCHKLNWVCSGGGRGSLSTNKIRSHTFRCFFFWTSHHSVLIACSTRIQRIKSASICVFLGNLIVKGCVFAILLPVPDHRYHSSELIPSNEQILDTTGMP